MTQKYQTYINLFSPAPKEVSDWVNSNLKNYLEKNPENQTEIEHILDFLLSESSPQKLKKMSYEEAKKGAEKWTKSLQKKGELKEKRGAVKTLKKWSNGYRVVKLKTKESYEREGKLMGHCVASYFGKDDEIYSLRDEKNFPHATFSRKSQQIKGKGNGKLIPKYVKYVVEFLEFLGMEVRDSEMKNLGYSVFPQNLKGIKNNLFRSKYIFDKELLKIDNLGIVDIHADDDYALRWAAEKGHFEIVKFLVENGANIHADGDSALCLAAEEGHFKIVKFLIKNGADIHAIGDYALCVAAENGHFKVVKFLLENGANIHARDDHALCWAAEKGHFKIVKFLVENGADIHARDDCALRWAAQNGHFEIVKFLVENGADVHALGGCALRLAAENNHTEIFEYLKSKC